MSDMYLINLETGGNQATIFATNKLRNVGGASELLYRVGTSYVTRALNQVTNQDLECEKWKEPIEDNSNRDFEIVISTSGKALLLARTEKKAKEFITAWSKIVVTEAPGIDAVAVCSNTAVDLSQSLDSYMQVYRETEKLMTMQRVNEGRPLTRFQRLPIVAECAFSGLPAVALDDDGQLVSASCAAQRKIYDDEEFKARMRKLFPDERSAAGCLSGLYSLEKKDWLAVVHADGNGLGQLFINFDKWVCAVVREKQNRDATGRDYVNYYRNFSSALDEISHAAFKSSVFERWCEGKPLIVPIVVGGDDLTVVMDGRESLEFVKRFMNEFCRQASSDPENAYSDVVRSVLRQAGLNRLGMCAGISIAKPHFPFAQSYHIAEGLMKNAKQVKKLYGPDSIALDFHILYDSVSTSIGDIRDRLRIKEEGNVGEGGKVRMLTAKPYVLERGSKKPENNSDPWVQAHKGEWEKVHDFKHFEGYVRALKGEMVTEQGEIRKMEEKLPSSQSHAVRESLFSELLNTQKSEWEFLLSTYREFKKAWQSVKQSDDLYIPVTITGAQPEEREYTYFLDALEAMKFLEEGGENA